uniref:uncharacterized protein LOC122610000 n=1 Tax=Erigeron canadensis TaxID=72917 RepID=UPI001CB93BD4|nr:uncharacterized protein LOC122610000 [Erigeron canadensis]
MALAGINNVSVLEAPYLGENYSSVSLTRTSIIRKMWRDLESENRTRETQRQQTGGMADGNTGSQCSCSSEGAESEDVSVTTSEAENERPRDQNQMEIQSGQENNVNLCIQRSAIGVADKERVRQVFREWASKNGSGTAAWNVSHKTNISRDQSPCETECKKVRAVRQWIESNPQQETGRPVIDEQAPETGCQVEQVCGGSGVDHTRGGVRRPVRGRQAFLDLLARFETERAKEMQILLESQLVSKFSHRNRIQALFRGRFLRNQSFVQDEKPSSTATKELGLLRQSNTVSDLRKGFLSGSDDDEQTLDGPQSDTSSDIDIKDHRENFQQLLGDIGSGFQTTSTESNAKTRRSPGVFYASIQKSHERVLVNEVRQQSPTQDFENRDPGQDQDSYLEINHGDHPVETSQRALKLENPTQAQFQPKRCRSPREYEILVEERHERGLENGLEKQSPPTEIIENKDQDRDQNGLVECNHRAPHIEPSEQILELESAAQWQYQLTAEELQVDEAFDHLNNSETSRGILACQDVPVETERHEQIIKENDSEWDDLTNTKVNKGSSAKLTENEVESVEERHGVLENEVQPPPPPPPVEVTENRDQDQDGSVERSHGAYYIEPSQRTLAIEIPARGQYLLSMQELEVNESLDHRSLTSSETSSLREGSVETEVWQEPTIEENGSEWDQLTNTEIFESSDANSVRNEDEWYQEAAGNDFQESLENWCGVGTSYQESPLVVTTSVFYTSGDDNGNRPELRELMNRRRVSNLLQSDFRVRLDQVVQSYAERRDQALESNDDWMLDQEQQHLDQQSVDENEDVTETVELSEVAYPDIHQHSGVEWDIINGLRFDMAKLQERMNSMQSTLETCISMQLELQRSMQQEVSSALSRLSTSGESSLQTCSLCCDNNIKDDSSPDRSGHVYVCSNCAEKVNWSKLKESVRHP